MIKVSKEDNLIFEKPGIKGWVRYKTPFSSKVPMIKIRYAFKENIDPDAFMDLLTTKLRRLCEVNH